jgi:hypothetical protein
VHISVCIIRNCDIIYIVIAVQVEVVNCRFLIVQASFKLFQCLRLLEQIHHSVEVEIVSRQTKVLFGIVLGNNVHGCCYKDCCYYGMYCFHGVQFLMIAFGMVKTKAVPKKKPSAGQWKSTHMIMIKNFHGSCDI